MELWIRSQDRESLIKADNLGLFGNRIVFIPNRPTGEGFIKDMFLYELANHEYCITYDLEDTLYALDLTYEEIKKDPRLKLGLQLAKNEYLASPENY